MKAMPPAPEFSRPIVIDRLQDHGMSQILTATEVERKLLSERFGLPEIKNLTANIQVAISSNRKNVHVTGSLSASVIQSCVVTLEPIPSEIKAAIDVDFIPEKDFDFGKNNLIDVDDENVEPIINGIIDLGETVAQHLGAALDPYPRKSGIDFVNAEYGGRPTATVSPLAKLIELKGKK